MDYINNATEAENYEKPLSEAIAKLTPKQKQEIKDLLKANQI